MDKPIEKLSLEQELNHRIFSDRVKQLSLEEAQNLLIELHQQMLEKDNIYKKLLLQQGKEIVDALFAAQ